MWIALGILVAAVVGGLLGAVMGMAGAVLAIPFSIFLGWAGAMKQAGRI